MSNQLTIEDYVASLPKQARGETCADIDMPRLNEQGLRVYRFCRDLRPHTLAEISAATGDGEASVSARLREIRAYLEDRQPGSREPGPNARGTIRRERVEGGNGLHVYSMRLKPYHGAA
jgi:hypothetical protein